MGDILDSRGHFITWDTTLQRGLPTNCHQAFLDLTANLVQDPVLDHTLSLQDFYVHNGTIGEATLSWKYQLPAAHLTSAWLPFMQRNNPQASFSVEGGLLTATKLSPPDPKRSRRMVVRDPGGAKRAAHGGPWMNENLILTQYRWSGGGQVINSSSEPLPYVYTKTQHRLGSTLQFASGKPCSGITIPETVWEDLWWPFRSAKKNAFLWQLLYELLYRAIATLHWSFPSRPYSDPSTWCPRCTAGVMADVVHCIYQCPILKSCWEWCGSLLARAGNISTRINLQPEQTLVAAPLLDSWDVPIRLWQICRATLCWKIWKSRNACVFRDQTDTPDAIVRKAWHRIGAHVRMEWQKQFTKIRDHRQTLSEARERCLAFPFGVEGVAWDLDNFRLQGLPCPPRPP